MNKQRIIPSLWIPAPADEVVSYYKNIFKKDIEINTDKELDNTPSGKTTIFTMTIRGFIFRVMCTGPNEDFTDAVSFELNCKDQDEIDYFWDALTKDGEESMCGWCRDKYGVRWQIVPENLDKLINSDTAFDIMLKQKKIIISNF